MQYIDIQEHGGPEALRVRQGEIPQPGHSQVLIKVEGIGINRPDVLQRKGLYPPPPGASPVPGLEVAGEVVSCGSGMNSPALGDKVCALLTGGGYAEYAVAETALCLPVPEGMPTAEAAALPETLYTVWSNVFDRGGLQAGEHFLVHGGSSGIGTTAIQLAQAFGARVYTTAGNQAKCQACLDLGAHAAINYHEEDFVAAAREASQAHGMDVILDMVAGGYIARDVELAAPDGRIVIIAVLAGASGQLNFAKVMSKRLTITGSTLRNRELDFKAAIARQLKEQVWPLLAAGKVKPVIHQTFPLAEAAAAHSLMESSEHIGKILLLP